MLTTVVPARSKAASGEEFEIGGRMSRTRGVSGFGSVECSYSGPRILKLRPPVVSGKEDARSKAHDRRAKFFPNTDRVGLATDQWSCGNRLLADGDAGMRPYALSVSTTIFASRSRTNSRVTLAAFARLISMSFLFAGTRSDLGSDMTYCKRSQSPFRS